MAFILVELATQDLPLRLLYNDLPITRPDGTKRLVIHDVQIVKIAANALNRNVAVMLLMLWSALLCLSRFRRKH